MIIELTKEKISEDQRKAIKYWTSTSTALHYQGIKKACENKYNGCKHDVEENHLKWFNGIESLFDQYDDNTKEYELIYRADIIDDKTGKHLLKKQIFENFCEKHTVKTIFKFDDMLCSFSTCKNAAKKAAKENIKYNRFTNDTPMVLYTLKKRLTKYLFIAGLTENSEEKEVLKFGNQSYQVIEQKIGDNNYVELIIIEVQ